MNMNLSQVVIGLVLLGVVYYSSETIREIITDAVLINEISIEFPKEIIVVDAEDTKITITTQAEYINYLAMESGFLLNELNEFIRNIHSDGKDILTPQKVIMKTFDPGLFERDITCYVGVHSDNAHLAVTDTKLADIISEKFDGLLERFSDYGLTTTLKEVPRTNI